MGAYYFMRAVSIAFYEALHPLLALKLATSWLNGMNKHEFANNVDKFDKPAHTDLFKILAETDLKRPQIQYILYFHRMFQTLNAFTARVDELFERSVASTTSALHLLSTHTSSAHLLDLASLASPLGITPWHRPLASPPWHHPLARRMLTIPYISAKDCSAALKYLQVAPLID